MLVKRRNSARLFYSTLGYVHSGNNGAFLSHLQKTLQTSLLKLLNQLCQRIQHCSEGWKNPMGGREHGRQRAGELPGHAQAMPRAGRWHWFCWANPSQVGLGDICLHSQQPHRFAIHQRVHMALLMQILEECCCWC